jgi:3-methyladenine DNA glycosylase/8-oxoguanine DNA glycosylase
VIEQLTSVKGIGPWTAQMFLMFELRRIDVWPTGDYGVRSGFASAFDLDSMPSPLELGQLGEAFAPYRSILAWWCWRETDSKTR